MINDGKKINPWYQRSTTQKRLVRLNNDGKRKWWNETHRFHDYITKVFN